MPIEYDPADAITSWPKGAYQAVLNNVMNTQSKKGNPMQVWNFTIYDDQTGKEKVIEEYVTAAAAFKIKQLAAALGQLAAFNAGTFQADDYINASLVLHLDIKEDPQFGDKNIVTRITAKPGITPPPIARQAPARAQPAPQPGMVRKLPPKPLATVPADNQPAIAEDDIPF